MEVVAIMAEAVPIQEVVHSLHRMRISITSVKDRLRGGVMER